MMQRPPPNSTADARQRCRTGSRHEAVSWLSIPHRLPGSKLEPKKIEMRIGKVAPPVRVLAIDDLRLLRMQHQLAGPKAGSQCAPQNLRLLGVVAMTDRIVRVALERNVRELPRHPHVEHVMQEQVRQQR